MAMEMASDNILGFREELLAKERELSEMQQLLLEQDGDLGSCRYRLGELESTLLSALSPSSSSSVTGIETLSPHPPTSVPLHPVERPLYENVHTAAVMERDDADGGVCTHAIPATTTGRGGGGDDLVLPEEHEEFSGTSSQLSLSPGTPPRLRTSPSHPERRQRWVPTETPPCRHRTSSGGSASPQQCHHRRDRRTADTSESTARLRQAGGIADTDTARNVLTVPLREADAAPEPGSVLVKAPIAVPTRAAEVHPVPSFFSSACRAAASGGAADSCGDSRAASIAAATAPTSSSLLSSSRRPTLFQRTSSEPNEERYEAHCIPLDSVAEASVGAGGEGSVYAVDAYGRRLDRSSQERQEQGTDPDVDEESYKTATAAGVVQMSDDDRFERNRGRHVTAGMRENDNDRGQREELRAGEAAERAAAAAATAAAVCGARAARDEAKRLRAEAVELSRWREAVLDLRDVLEIAHQGDGEGTINGDARERATEDDPVARHAKWVSSPALGMLLPRLHQRARELLADLAAERARLGASPAEAAAAAKPQSTAAATRPCPASIGGAGHARCGEHARPVAAEGGPLVEASKSGDLNGKPEKSRVQCEQARKPEDQLRVPYSDTPRHVGCIKSMAYGGGEVQGTKVSATATARLEVGGKQAEEKQLASLQKECETSRIVVHALREKDEGSQKRIFALEEELFQASLAKVKQEALVTLLRRRLESHNSPSAECQRVSPLIPQRTGRAAKSAAPAAAAAAAAAASHSRGRQDDAPPRRNIPQRLSRLRNEIAVMEPSTPTPMSTPLPRLGPRNNPACRGVSSSRSCGHGEGAIAAAGRSVVPGRLADDGYGCGSSGEIELERENHGRSCRQPPTPTTDILRRLLYESSPMSSRAEQSEGKSRKGAVAAADNDDDGGGFENAGRRSRHGRRLFAEGSAALRARPVDSDQVAGVRRGPSSLFVDFGCEVGTAKAAVGDPGEANGCGPVVVVSRDGDDRRGPASVSVGLKAAVATAAAATTEKPGGDAMTGRLATSEVVLRERLLQARKEFSALRTRAPID